MADSEASRMRERILSEAARLFVTHGFDGISMREIADACGISKAGLYYHFKDKEDLFLAILSANLAELGQIIDEAEAAGEGAREKIAFFVRTIFSRLPADRRAIIRLASQEMDKVTPEARTAFDRRYREQFINRLARLIQAGIASGQLRTIDPGLGVWGLLGLMYPFFNMATSESDQSERDMEPIVAFILSVFFEGVQARD